MGIFPQLIANSIIAGSVYLLIAVGFNLAYGATKFFNLAHGAMAVVGGYTAFFALRNFGIGAVPATVLAVLVAGLFGYLLDKFVYLPLRRRKSTSMVLLVASLGVFTAIQALIAIFFTSQFQTLSRYVGDTTTFTFAGGVFTNIQLIILICGILITGGLVLILKKTFFGKAVRAISDDEEVARIVGINTNKIIGYVFFIASAIAGLGGVLVGFDTGIEPTMGLPLLLKGIIAAIIGGIGSIPGAFLGSFLLGFVENFGIWHINAEWKDAIAFALLILFLIFRPQGIIKK